MSRPDDLLICPACGRSRARLIFGRCGDCGPGFDRLIDYRVDAQRQPANATAPHGTASTQRPDSTANTPSTTAENTTHAHTQAPTANTTVTTEPTTDLTSSTPDSVQARMEAAWPAIRRALVDIDVYEMAVDAGVRPDLAEQHVGWERIDVADLIARFG